MARRLPPATPATRARTCEVQNQMAQRFPTVFLPLGTPARRVLPLVRGIHTQLSAALGDAFTADELAYFLRAWTLSPRYLASVAAPGAMRHDLAGAAVEPVSAADAQQARLAAAASRRRRDAARDRGQNADAASSEVAIAC